MRYCEILNEYRIGTASMAIRNMPIEERHEWMEFLISWLSGSYMNKQTVEHLKKWEKFSEMFPTGLAEPKKLLRLVTIPIEYASREEFYMAKPAPGPVSSWSSTKRGIDCVAGVANDFLGDDPNSARLAISAVIDPKDILATTKTIRYAILAFSHDFAEKFGYDGDNGWEHEDWPKKNPTPYANSDELYYPYNMTEVGYYQSVNQDFKGGAYNQYEYIVKTRPMRVKRSVIYRLGSKTVKDGNDDPHN